MDSSGSIGWVAPLALGLTVDDGRLTAIGRDVVERESSALPLRGLFSYYTSLRSGRQPSIVHQAGPRPPNRCQRQPLSQLGGKRIEHPFVGRVAGPRNLYARAAGAGPWGGHLLECKQRRLGCGILRFAGFAGTATELVKPAG
ncbi:MAG: hypothetical protein AAGG75_12215 [Bacteroidota bacterium]